MHVKEIDAYDIFQNLNDSGKFYHVSTESNMVTHMLDFYKDLANILKTKHRVSFHVSFPRLFHIAEGHGKYLKVLI